MALSDQEKKLAQSVEQRLQNELGGTTQEAQPQTSLAEQGDIVSKEYDDFRKENLPGQYSWYEKACQFSEQVMKASPDKTMLPKLQESIYTCHLNITPESATSFVYVGSVAVFFAVLVLGGVIAMLMALSPNTADQAADFIMFALFMGLILAMMAYVQIKNMPVTMAAQWRMKASNNMIICVFYMVTYMRHTSNMENGVRFAAEHVGFPLSLDMKRVIWNVETEQFSSITESMDAYLEGWKDYAPEFVESVHLIESSLLQGDEERRLGSLDKSLSNILEQTYEKMLHYAHNLQGPLSNLNMLGVILPVLGMVILPLVISMMDVQWYVLFGLYNIILFVVVFNLGNKILASRPNGYGDTADDKATEQFKILNVNLGFTTLKMKPSSIGIAVAIMFLVLALFPMILYQVNPTFDEQFINSVSAAFPSFETMLENLKPLDYRIREGKTTGPFGLLATLLSFGFTLSAGLGLGTYFKTSSSNVIKIRERTKKLEEEFAGSLFQLGNRLEDGYPTEVALGKVGETLEGSPSGEFFKQASDNVQRLGMGVEEAIFNKENGAIKNFPSSLIASTMKVLVESAKKGPKIAAQAMVNVSQYIKEIHKVDERLKDLMSETLASMKSQIKMLTPLISAIVVGITSLIIGILGSISAQTEELGQEAGGSMAASMFGEGVPTYYFQIVVGIYVVQIVYLLTKIVNGIENGSDKLSEDYQMGTNLVKSSMIYTMVAMIAIIAFTALAQLILAG
jgi:hypothetical protein